MSEPATEPAILEIEGLRNAFGDHVIHDGLDLTVRRGELLGIVGGSGTGKSVLLRSIVGLHRPEAGSIRILGQDGTERPARSRTGAHPLWGMLFQDGALFSSLTVAQNVEAPMIEHSDLPQRLRRELVGLKIALAGLPADAALKYPSELSGGMRKRAGMARALALDPAILLLDEPTAGLDPIGANQFDELILGLRDALGLTVVMVTHDLDSLYALCDRVAVLLDKRVKVGTLEELADEPDPWIREYFGGPRGRAAAASAERQQTRA